MHLNSEIFEQLDNYKKLWQENGIVTITDLLCPVLADDLNEYLLDLPEERWDVSIHPYLPQQYTFSNTSDNQDFITKGIKSANDAYNRGEFSYCFRRYEGYSNDGIKIKELISSADFLQTINDITGASVKDVISVFASMYTSNSFLSIHTDTGRGKIAFVLNLTKDWDENNGGCFELLTPDWCNVKRRVCPQFNSLTFFNVEGDGVPHRVTRIHENITAKRIAFSGWLI